MGLRYDQLVAVLTRKYGVTVKGGSGSHRILTRPGAERPYPLQAHNGDKSEIPEYYLKKLCPLFGIDENELRAELNMPQRKLPKTAEQKQLDAERAAAELAAQRLEAEEAARRAALEAEEAELMAQLEREEAERVAARSMPAPLSTSAEEPLAAASEADVAAVSEPTENT